MSETRTSNYRGHKIVVVGKDNNTIGWEVREGLKVVHRGHATGPTVSKAVKRAWKLGAAFVDERLELRAALSESPEWETSPS